MHTPRCVYGFVLLILLSSISIGVSRISPFSFGQPYKRLHLPLDSIDVLTPPVHK